jgi:hypothetical protein
MNCSCHKCIRKTIQHIHIHKPMINPTLLMTKSKYCIHTGRQSRAKELVSPTDGQWRPSTRRKVGESGMQSMCKPRSSPGGGRGRSIREPSQRCQRANRRSNLGVSRSTWRATAGTSFLGSRPGGRALVSVQHLTPLPWACMMQSGELNDHYTIVLKDAGGNQTVGVQRRRQAEMKAI